MINPVSSDNFSLNIPFDPTNCIGEYKEFIGIYQNKVSKLTCDTIIDAFDRYDSALHEDSQFPDRTLGRYDTYADLNNIIFSERESIISYVRESLLGCIREYISIFQGCNVPQYLTHLKVQKTPPGGGYHVWHCENHNHLFSSRSLVWMLYLNDIEEGGETEFLYQSIRIRPTTGTILLWPPGYTHMHRGNPPLSETKYIITGWCYHYPEQNL